MAKRSDVPRTVQFWRLVDARDDSLVAEVDWDTVLRHLYGERRTFGIDGREHAGTIVPVNVPHEWSDFIGVADVPDAQAPENEELTHGVVIAAGKDYVPNQEDVGSGAQKPMGLDGDNWSPVDNLFVWHLPFGNMIGVLAESTSSSKAGKYADWLTRATRELYDDDPGFAWAARPVIDMARANLIRKAHGLRSFVYAGEMGEAVNEASGAKAIFVGPNRKRPTAIRIEVKASLVRGKSAPHEDEQVLLDWFNDTFGSLDGEVSKAQVSLPASEDAPASEVDLLHHRLTRKVRVPLALGTTRAFRSTSAVGAIVEAFGIDRAELLKLRYNKD
ncbi:hypothetical protein QFZ53_003708 [Microbacterium natoriense]|uniref:Uncharacterized protein n=1 Tax=Microbacterium natoriense TaxID=284570 RepID=A0AAW8F2Q6_9MICO|nr:hypothetical protein [Microbacterium natoriense]MDQ0649512.1 hypothetical protein [Microbacterium natoriense]